MTTLLLDIAKSLVRKGGIALSVYLIAHGILTPEQGDRLIVEALKIVAQYGPALAVSAWGGWSAYMNRVKLKTAMQMPPTTEEHVEAVIKNGMGAKAT